MQFHTWTFAAFFLIVYPVHLLLRNTAAGKYWLLLASLFFYGWWQAGERWSAVPLCLLLYCTAVDYAAAHLMARCRWKKTIVAAAVMNHVLVLAYFKYAAFVVQNVNAALAWFGFGALNVPEATLPLGLSFYTLLAISYIVDVYRGAVEMERNPVRLAALVAFFPKLVAGPIERATTLLPKLRGKVHISAQSVADGLSLFLVGFFKKRAIADFLALYTGKVFADPTAYNAPDLLLATFAFAWQVYFDLSGYTDMARGIARMMGYDLMLNFNKPYLSTDLTEFWRRWHISLSTWFRDYVYIPLGGNRRSRPRVWFNLCITMVISGLWHGAGWAWAIWGALHGVGLCVNKYLDSLAWYQRVPKPVKRVLVLGFVCLTWVFFAVGWIKGGSPGDAFATIVRIFTTPWTVPSCPVVAILLCVAVWVHQAASESRWCGLLERRPVRVALALAMLVYLFFGASGGVQQFIYGGRI